MSRYRPPTPGRWGKGGYSLAGTKGSEQQHGTAISSMHFNDYLVSVFFMVGVVTPSVRRVPSSAAAKQPSVFSARRQDDGRHVGRDVSRARQGASARYRRTQRTDCVSGDCGIVFFCDVFFPWFFYCLSLAFTLPWRHFSVRSNTINNCYFLILFGKITFHFVLSVVFFFSLSFFRLNRNKVVRNKTN